jgi:hypothetical protein
MRRITDQRTLSTASPSQPPALEPRSKSHASLTDDISLHEMEPVQVRLRLARVVRALKHDIRGALRLEVRVVAETDLPDGTVFPEDLVEVGTGEVEVARCVSGERGEWRGLGVWGDARG